MEGETLKLRAGEIRRGIGHGSREGSDAALVRTARRGDEEAMRQLFVRHWARAHRAAYLVVHDAGAAEDIVQEAWVSAIRALDRFDRRRPFGPWLHRIVTNRAIDWARARAARPEVLAGPDEWAGAGEATDTGAAPGEEIMAALRTLPPEHRAVVVLRYLLEYTPGEIADLLELPRGTVNSRLRRGLDSLSPLLEHEREGTDR